MAFGSGPAVFVAEAPAGAAGAAVPDAHNYNHGLKQLFEILKKKKKSFHFWPTTLAQDSEIFTIQEVDNGMTSQNGLGSSHTPIIIKICFFSKKKFLWFCFFFKGAKILSFPPYSS